MLNRYTEFLNLGLLKAEKRTEKREQCEHEKVLGQGSWRVQILTLDLPGTSYMTLPKAPVYTEEKVFCSTCL